MINFGFTGTSGSITPAQKQALIDYFKNGEVLYQLHHGDCIGGDALIDSICISDSNCKSITIHPPTNPKKRAFCNSIKTTILNEKEYLKRNHDIVDDADLLFALPNGMNEELRSGTWATIRYAKKQEKPILVFWPDGTITEKLS